MYLLGKNLYIVNKKAQQVREIELNGTLFSAKSENGAEFQEGTIDLEKDVYACLYYNKLNTVVFIVYREKSYMASLVFSDKSQYEEFLELIRQACPALDISEQNAKINGYAMSVVAKLNEGVTVKILETKDEKKAKCCPECGMECDPNIPYCMECGASV